MISRTQLLMERRGSQVMVRGPGSHSQLMMGVQRAGSVSSLMQVRFLSLNSKHPLAPLQFAPKAAVQEDDGLMVYEHSTR